MTVKSSKKRRRLIRVEGLSELPDKLKLLAVEGQVLGVQVYRGFARLCDLANISEADG